jgi:large subunit ribosomal protein L14
MIHIQTKLNVNDNSGIKLAQCLKIYKKKTGQIGDIILISIKNLKTNSSKKKLLKGDLLKAVIIYTKYKNKNTIGNLIKFDINSIIILNNQNKPLGTRIFGPITSTFRKLKNFKILSIANNII